MRARGRTTTSTIDRDLAAVQEKVARDEAEEKKTPVVEEEEEEEEDEEDEEDEEEDDKDETPRRDALPSLRGREALSPARVPLTPPDEETGAVKNINEWIEKLRNDDTSYITAWRVKPEYIDGKEAAGMSGRWSIGALRNADDLLADLENKSGGTMYDIRFNGTKAGRAGSTRVGQLKQVRVQINAAPILRAGTAFERSVPEGTPSEVEKGTYNVLTGIIKDLRENNKSSGTDVEVLKLMTKMQDSQASFFKDEIEKIRSASSPSIEASGAAVKESVKEFARERERWENDRTKIVSDFERERMAWQTERSKLLSDHERERNGLNDKLSAQIDKLAEKLESAQEKLKEREESFSRERLERDRSIDERTKHRDDMHQRDVQAVRDQWTNDAKAIRDQWTNESKRLSDQLSDERRSSEKLKEMYDLAKKAELDKQEGIFREQAEGLKNRISMLEERIRDLEKQKEGLQADLLTSRTSKPDPLSTVRETLGAVSSIAGVMGLKPGGGDAPAGEQRTEIGQLMKDAKDAGVMDAAKGVIDTVASVMRRPQAPVPQPFFVPPGMPQFMPPGSFPMAMGQQGFYPPQMYQSVPSAPQPVYPQPVYQAQEQYQAPQPPPPPVQQQAPTPTPPAPAPEKKPEPVEEKKPELSELEVQAWKQVVKGLEESNESGKPVPQIAEQLFGEIPRMLLKDIIEAGVTNFQATVAKICELRPEEPESVLLTPRGETWLRDLLDEVQKLLDANP